MESPEPKSSTWIDYSSDEEENGFHQDESTPYQYTAPDAADTTPNRDDDLKKNLTREV